MSDDEIELTRRKILASAGAIGLAGVGAGLGTSAYFNDEESFTDNSLTAGELDMKASWDEHYFDGSAGTQYGEYVDGGSLDGHVGFPSTSENPVFGVDESSVGDFMSATRQERFPEGGLGDANPCEALADVPGDLQAPVIELDDVKPGDFGEVTFDFALCSNPGYVWMTGQLAEESDNGTTEPEAVTEGDTAISDGDDGATTQVNGELTATNLNNSGATPADLAESLVADEGDVDIVDGSVTFTGDNRGAGGFSGGTDVVGLDEGIILSSGNAETVEGPNDADSATTDIDTSGDSDLDALSGGTTYDASVLEFEFTVPDDAEQVFFNYVFGSEEYNEWVGSQYNDVFGFFVNGENAAVIPDPSDGTQPVAINNINNNENSDLYVDNDPGDNPSDELLDTEMDGFTVPLSIEADVNPGETNTMKLAIADTGDHIYDSWVLIEAGTLSTEPPTDDQSELPDAVQARAWYDADCDNVHDDGEQEFLEGTLREVLTELSSGKGAPLDGDESVNTDFDEMGGDPTADSRDCYAPAPEVNCIGFEWWLPTDVGNEVQSDSVTFDLGFYTEQCRHNDGTGQTS